ncbi:MAG: alpha-galactosidase, partial [Bryobacterales bacterium]|nr:alpha-galactosidase [Bryobacterales bacterium]
SVTGCTAFTTDVGVDDEVGSNGSVIFQVWVDGTKQYDSGLMTGATATKTATLTLSGNTELRLVITDGGTNGINSDHGDWAAAKITCGS